MSIQSEITRLTDAKTAIITALTNKGVTVPDGAKVPDFAALIDAIEAGGNIRVKQGSVTFAETSTYYRFVNDDPDIFIAYIEDDSSKQYNQCQYVWAMMQDKRVETNKGGNTETAFFFGYNSGTSRYYTPLKGSYYLAGTFSSSNFNGKLGATTYKWYAIYGVTAT